MAYERIDWENEPSVDTPLNEDNLNHMEDGIVQNETDIAGKMNANNPTGTGSLQVGTGNMKTDGNPSYALGYNAYAEGDNSFAFGSSTRAKKQGAYAIGTHAEAREYFSMALGEEVIAASIHQTVRGKYNEIDADGVYLDIVGGGNPLERKNVETLTPNGDKWVAGDYTNGNGETLHGIYEALPVDSASGNPAVITDAFGGACKSLKLTLNPIQSGSGTPSPSNVRPISGLTEANVVRTGKNLLPQLCDAGTKASVTLTKNSDGSYTMSGSPSANNQFQSVAKLKLFPGTYIWRASADGTSDIGSDANGYAYLMGVNGSGEWIRSYGNSTLTVTVESEVTLGFAWYNATSLNITFYPMIRPSSITDAIYEPYNGESITRTYGTTVYGGADDVTGEGATSEWGSVVFDGSNDENWTKFNSGSASAFAMIIPVPNGETNTVNDSNIKCDKLTSLSTSATWGSFDWWVSLYVSNIVIGIQSITTVEDLRTWLSSNPLHVIYKLATPTSIPLTAQNITLLHGDNVLTTDADSIEASYSADIALYIAKKIAEGVNSTRSLSKGGLSEPEEETKEETKEEIKEEPTQEK